MQITNIQTILRHPFFWSAALIIGSFTLTLTTLHAIEPSANVPASVSHAEQKSSLASTSKKLPTTPKKTVKKSEKITTKASTSTASVPIAPKKKSSPVKSRESIAHKKTVEQKTQTSSSPNTQQQPPTDESSEDTDEDSTLIPDVLDLPLP